MKNSILRLGPFYTVLLITIVAILAATSLLYIISFVITIPNFTIALTITIIITTLVTPFLSWYVVKLIFHINELEEDMRELATFDSLTKLSTRQSFLDTIQVLYQLAKRNTLPFAILYIDVDNFKSINDTYGHTVGDKVLQSLGKIFQTNKRESDIIGRLGGEEFAFALSDVDLKGATFFAEKIRKLVENEMFNNEGIYINYTISIGISIYNEVNNVELDKLITQADTALYEAKSSGKNCVKVYKEALG